MNQDINRLKVVLAEKKRTNKWLAEQLGKDPATVSKWCTNKAQPNLETLIQIAACRLMSKTSYVQLFRRLSYGYFKPLRQAERQLQGLS